MRAIEPHHTQPTPDDVSDADQKERVILAAAKVLFLDLGYAATSMDLLAQKAHVSKTTLYTRFPSKAALFGAVIDAECRSRGMNFRSDDLRDLPLADALRFVGYRLSALMWSPEAVRMEQVLLGESNRFPEIARIFHDLAPLRLCETLGEFFEQRVAQGEISATDPRFVAEQFLASMKGWTYREVLFGLRDQPSDAEREAVVDATVDLFLKGALPPQQSD